MSSRDPRRLETGKDERCPVCGVLMYVHGFPFAQDHIFGPVLDTATGIEYPGHPVEPPVEPF